MRCKTSCFNPTLAKHSLKRFWPLPVIIFLFLLVAMVFSYYTTMLSIGSGTMETSAVQYTVEVTDRVEHIVTEENSFTRQYRSAIYNYGGLIIVFQIFTALASALLVMHHIHGRKQIQFYHGLPLTRRGLYITNVVTGYAMALIPTLLSELILMIIALAMGAEAFPALQLMGITAASFTIYYAVAVVACVLAGQSFGAVLLYAGMNCFMVAISSGGAGVMRYILYGFNEHILLEGLTTWLTPVLYMMNYSSPMYTETGVGMPYGYYATPFVVYAIAGVLLLVLGGFLYKIRRGETAGEMIAFPFIRGLCKVLVALMAGLGGTVIVVLALNPYEDITFPVIALLVMALLILGWIAAEMVIRKTFRVFGKSAVAQCLSLAVVVLLILVGGKLDVFGYVNRTPDLSRVAEAQLQLYGLPVEVEPTDALKFHETVLENMEELSNNTTYRNVDSISIDYYDEDQDLVMQRQYYVKDGLDSTIMQEFMELMSVPEYNYRSWFSWQDTEKISEDLISTVQLYSASRYLQDDGVEKEVPYLIKDGQALVNNWMELTVEEGYGLYEAICRDIQEGNLLPQHYTYFTSGKTEYGNIEFHVYDEPYDPSFGTYEEYRKKASMNYHYIVIYEGMTHTLKALEELGITLNPEALK